MTFILKRIFDFWQSPFLCLMRWSCDLSLSSLCDGSYELITYLNPYMSGMKPTQLWWMIFLLRVSIWLPMFIENFCTFLHPGEWTVIFFFCCFVFIWIWCQGNTGFIENLEAILHVLFHGQFEQYWYEFLEGLIVFCSESIWFWAFLNCESFYYCFNLIPSCGSV